MKLARPALELFLYCLYGGCVSHTRSLSLLFSLLRQKKGSQTRLSLSLSLSLRDVSRETETGDKRRSRFRRRRCEPCSTKTRTSPTATWRPSAWRSTRTRAPASWSTPSNSRRSSKTRTRFARNRASAGATVCQNSRSSAHKPRPPIPFVREARGLYPARLLCRGKREPTVYTYPPDACVDFLFPSRRAYARARERAPTGFCLAGSVALPGGSAAPARRINGQHGKRRGPPERHLRAPPRRPFFLGHSLDIYISSSSACTSDPLPRAQAFRRLCRERQVDQPEELPLDPVLWLQEGGKQRRSMKGRKTLHAKKVFMRIG